MKKLISKAVFGIATMSFAVLSYASPFIIHNNTDSYITSIINNGPCSSIFGKEGTTNPHETGKISEATARIACIVDSSHCKVEVFLSKSCKGGSVGKVVFSTSKGINKIENNAESPVSITGEGFIAAVNPK